MFNRKITIIGAGNVGAATAYTLAIKGLATEIVLVDVNEAKAVGEALDIYHGTPLMDSPVNVYAGSYEDAKGSGIVVITSGLPRRPDQTRLELTQTNVNILKQIAPRISALSCRSYSFSLTGSRTSVNTITGLKAVP